MRRPRHKRTPRRPRRIVTAAWCIVAGLACLIVPAGLTIGAEVRDWVEPAPALDRADHTEVMQP